MEIEDPYGFIDDRCDNLGSGSDSEGSGFPYFEPEADEKEMERLFLMTMQSTQSTPKESTPKETFHTPPEYAAPYFSAGGEGSRAVRRGCPDAERVVDLESDSCSETAVGAASQQHGSGRKRVLDFERRPLSRSKKPRLSAEEQKKTILEITMRLECPGFYADTARRKVKANLEKSVNSLKNYGSTFLREVGIDERRSKCKMNFSLVLHRSSPEIIDLEAEDPDGDIETVNNLGHDTDAMETEQAGRHSVKFGSAHVPRMRDELYYGGFRYGEGKDLSLHGKGNAIARGESVLNGGNKRNAEPRDHQEWGRYSGKSNGVQNSQMGGSHTVIVEAVNGGRRRYSSNAVVAGDYVEGGVGNVDNPNMSYKSIYGSPQLDDFDNPNIRYKSTYGSPQREDVDNPNMSCKGMYGSTRLEVCDHQGKPRSAATINLRSTKYSSGNKEAVRGNARIHNDRENLGAALRRDHQQDDIKGTTSEHGEIRSRDGENLNAQAFQGRPVERFSESVYDVEKTQDRFITGNNVANPSTGAVVDKGSGKLPSCVDNREPEPPCIEIQEAASRQSKFHVCDVLKRLAANPKDPIISKENTFDVPPCVDNQALEPPCIEIPEAASGQSKFDVCDDLKMLAAHSKDPVIVKERNFDVADALIVLALSIKNHGATNEHVLDMSGLVEKLATNSKEKGSAVDFAKKQGMTFPSLRRS